MFTGHAKILRDLLWVYREVGCVRLYIAYCIKTRLHVYYDHRPTTATM